LVACGALPRVCAIKDIKITILSSGVKRKRGNIVKFEPNKTMSDERIESSKAPEPVGLYPHARKVGNLLFLSGVGPRERGSKKIPGVEVDEKGNIVSYDIEAQCHSVFRNIRFILEDAGSSWDKIVDVTVFLTNMKDDFPKYNKIWAEYFKENPPCRTTIEINKLPTPIAIELKVMATV
jgi:2-aminomuconate deaminase